MSEERRNRGNGAPGMAGPVPQEVMRGRALFCGGVILLLLLLVLFRLWQVQVLSGSEHQRRARRQALRPVRVNSVRGRIFDATGKTLVENQDSYDLVFYVSEMRQPGRQARTLDYVLATERALAGYLGRPSHLDRETVRRQLTRRPVLPLAVFEDLTPAEVVAFSEYLPTPQGVEVMPVARRRYPFPGVLSQVLGYTGRMQPAGDDVLEDLPRLYTTPELRGRSGLEQAFDQELAGRPGVKLLLVDPVGYARKTLDEGQDAEDGQDLVLTIDIHAQSAAEEALAGHSGALVAVDVETGAVVAMASAPTFSLDALDSAALSRMLNDNEARPMFNRATQGTYTPGSIVKPLVALAALEEIPGIAHGESFCDGRFTMGKTVIRCARRYGHGPLDLSRAIMVSCNPFFLHLGVEMGIDVLGGYYHEAGFGERTGLELRDAAGISPERPLAQKLWKRNWLAIDTAYASIGQGAITVTPLQAALYAAALANGGKLYRPYLVQRVQTQDGKVLRNTAPQVRKRLLLEPENLQLVQEAMVQAVENHEGGANRLRLPNLPVAAKTGTAEVGSGENRHKNAWCIAFFPADQPKYALACLVEHGDSGGKTAVPIAARFLGKWLQATPQD